ncbi:MAG: PEF-CTERM sorting domain-containing protein [Halobacteriota archaeon]|nr:PEF-CTERM sorting domain-containing protein [Halobacteriota archaeon]
MKNMMQIKKLCYYISLMLCTSLLLVGPTSALAGGVQGHLWLEAIGGVYVENHSDSWLVDSSVTSATDFNLNVTNRHKHEDLYHLYLIVAVDRKPEGNMTIKVNGTELTDWTLVTDQQNQPKVAGFNYPPHGIFLENSDVWFNVTEIGILGGVLNSYNSMVVPINITLIGAQVKVHFDAVGTDSGDNAVVFVPPSHDVTYQTPEPPEEIPEFPTVAIPAAMIIGLVFVMQRRKGR